MNNRTPLFTLRLDHGVLPPPGGPVKTRLAVRAIIERDGLWLMVYSPVGGDWKFPGGGVEPRETPEEALVREIREETGYEAVGPFGWIGRAVERSEGLEVPGSLFEMESRYYRARVTGEAGQLHLDHYEKNLGFTPCWVKPTEALEANAALLASAKSGLPPWLERETRVLGQLVGSNHGSLYNSPRKE